MSAAALVPVQSPGRGKSRLRSALGSSATERLILAMLRDVLEALGSVPALSRVIVVTPDADVARRAEAAGAEGWLREDPGLNPALDAATRDLTEQGVREVLVLLGDVAGARPEELSALFPALAGLGGRGVVLAPARDGGTGALLRAPADVIPGRFGKESAAAHRALARDAGVPYAELPLASLAVDVDRLEDARALLDAPGARHSRALLRELGIEVSR